MFSLKSALVIALCAVFTTASPVILEKRQGTTKLSTVTCGSNKYTKAQVDAAAAEGCRLYAANRQIGSSQYPHRFNNFEGLVFASSGPYQEFPILSSGIYSGGAPGADRVSIDPSYQGKCVYVGAMTHTGASSTNGFVSCKEAVTADDTKKSAAPALVVWGAPATTLGFIAWELFAAV